MAPSVHLSIIDIYKASRFVSVLFNVGIVVTGTLCEPLFSLSLVPRIDWRVVRIIVLKIWRKSLFFLCYSNVEEKGSFSCEKLISIYLKGNWSFSGA